MKLYTSSIYAFNFVILLSFFRSSEANSVASTSSLLPVNVCAIVNCVQGTCLETNSSLLGFECDCNPGWKQYQIGFIVLPLCIIPDYTLNFGCGTGNPSPPPIPPSLPNFNLSDLCSLAWCGNGSCKTDGTDYECDCNEGSDNLLDKPALPCFNECALDADRHGLGTPSSSAGLREVGRVSTIEDSLKVLLILGVQFLPWL